MDGARIVVVWLLRTVATGLIFGFFFYVLDPAFDPLVLHRAEIAAAAVLAATLAATGAAIGAGRLDVEGKGLDWLLFVQISVLICITYRLLEPVMGGTLLRFLASSAAVTLGALVVSVGASLLANRFRGAPPPA